MEIFFKNQTRFFNIHSQYYFLNCFFYLISNNNNGGAIFFSVPKNFSSTIFKISYSMFLNCFVTSGYGGAIYSILSNDGILDFNKICGSNCFTNDNDWDQFCFLSISNFINSEINYLSISYCSPLGQSRWCSSRIILSNSNIINTNSSFHQNGLNSGIYLGFANNLNFSFSNLCNSYSTYQILFIFDGINNGKLINNNFINNSQGSNSFGILTSWNSNFTFILNCNFFNNRNNNNGKLFFSKNSILTIQNCFSNDFTWGTSEIAIITFISNNNFISTFYLNLINLNDCFIIFSTLKNNYFFNNFKLKLILISIFNVQFR